MRIGTDPASADSSETNARSILVKMCFAATECVERIVESNKLLLVQIILIVDLIKLQDLSILPL